MKLVTLVLITLWQHFILFYFLKDLLKKTIKWKVTAQSYA